MFLPCRSRRQEAAIALQRDDGRGAGPPSGGWPPVQGSPPARTTHLRPHHATPFPAPAPSRCRPGMMPVWNRRNRASLSGAFLNTQYEYNFPEPIPAPETVMSIKSVAFDHPTSAGACGVGQAWARVPAPQSPDQQRQAADRLRRLLRARRGDDRPLLRGWRAAGPGARNRRLRRRFAGNGALRRQPSRVHPGGGRRAFHGRNRQDPQPAQARADAGRRGHLLAGPGLSRRRVRPLLRRPSRPHRGGLRQHQRRGEGAGRLGRDVLGRTGHRGAPARPRRKDPVGPDRHLGAYIQARTGADMLLWQGSCVVHDEFKADEWPRCRASIRKRPSWSIPNRRPASPRRPMWSAPRRS